MIVVPTQYAGELRHPHDIAKEYITFLSEGEWGPEVIEKEAASLSYLLVKYADSVVADRERSK